MLAALPTGTVPFMLADFYHREADIPSSIVLSSTVLSIVTVSLYLTMGCNIYAPTAVAKRPEIHGSHWSSCRSVGLFVDRESICLANLAGVVDEQAGLLHGLASHHR